MDVHDQQMPSGDILTSIDSDQVLIKGQMNQKIDIFSFVALLSPNTKKNHP